MPEFNPQLLYSKYNNDIAEEQRIAKPLIHIARISGKKFRSKLAKAVNDWFHAPEDKLQVIGNILEILHNSSLLIDDIQDESLVRRGLPTSHLIYGIPRTVNSGNYAAYGALEKVYDLYKTEGVKIVIARLLEMYRGQGMEIYWRDHLICPTIPEYKLMCIRKTGNLFLIGIELIQLFSDFKFDLIKFGENVGLYFQVRDDYLNLCPDKYDLHKGFCDDLSEGKFSFPIIHAVETQPKDKRILNIVKQRTQDMDTKKHCLSLLKKFGSIEYTHQVLKKLKHELHEDIDKMPKNQIISHVLDEVLKI